MFQYDSIDPLFFQSNPIAQSNQVKQKSSKSSPKKTYPTAVSQSGYKINPIVLETQRQMEAEDERKRRSESFTIDTNPLGLNYRELNDPTMRAREYRTGQTKKTLENRNEQERSPGKQNRERKTSKNESSNVLVVRQPSNAGYVRRKPQEAGRHEATQNGESHEVEHLTDLRARLRRTGQIEEGSGLHRIELARQHSQRIIDVQ